MAQMSRRRRYTSGCTLRPECSAASRIVQLRQLCSFVVVNRVDTGSRALLVKLNAVGIDLQENKTSITTSLAALRRSLRHRNQIAARRSRSAFAMTETELKLIAAAAIIGLSKMPKNG